MADKKVIIIGGGPAGITAGYQLSKNIMGEKHDIWDVNADEEYHEEY